MTATPTTALSFQNFFSATLSADITASSTDIFLDTIPNGSEGFLVIDPDSSSSREVIYYNSKTALKVTCPSVADGRGQDDTSASAHLSGTTVIMAPVAAYYEALQTLFTTSPQGWTSMAGTVTGVTANGNRSYDLAVDTDQTAVISPGMRLRTTRTNAAPTQCTDLEASSSQYYSRASAGLTGITFTDDFVVSAWVKLESYTTGTIASRFNGTSGWVMTVLNTGQVRLAGFNAGGANSSYVQSYQSLPLGKWVHVTAQLDMSAFTATTTTSYVMLDGVDVPASVSRAGTNPTALIQAGDLNIGAYNNASEFFDGKIAQVAIYNAKVTQANIRATISQGLAGNETSLISAYSFNNTINDLSANANNLTANGSAVATNADSPFGGQAGGTISSTLDYGIVQKITASTITVQVAEGCTIPTSASGVSAVSYSTYKSPFGFPGQEGKWQIASILKFNATQVSPTGSTWYNVGPTTGVAAGSLFSLPIGEWNLGHKGSLYATKSASTSVNVQRTLSTSSSSETDTFLTVAGQSEGASGTMTVLYSAEVSTPVSASSLTPYYLNFRTTSASVGVIGSQDGNTGFNPGVIYADNAYL